MQSFVTRPIPPPSPSGADPAALSMLDAAVVHVLGLGAGPPASSVENARQLLLSLQGMT
jgi:hypothetical protein